MYGQDFNVCMYHTNMLLLQNSSFEAVSHCHFCKWAFGKYDVADWQS